MKTRLLPALTTLFLLAAGCGDQQSGGTPAAPAVRLSQAAAAQPASSYEGVVQQIYVAYFGRAADAGGLVYFEGLLAAANAPTTLAGLSSAYATNAGVRGVVDIFGTSQESRDLYAGDNSAFIAAVYANLFNRAPDSAGQAYWAKGIDNGQITRANAAISIMAGAQGSDATTITAKTTVARNFTKALDTDAKAAAYSGLAVNASVRSMLGFVSASTNTTDFQNTVTATVARLVAAPPTPVVNGEANGDVGADAAHAGSIVVGSAVTGQFATWEDVDWYGVDLVAGTIYTIDIQGAAGKLAPWVWLHNHAGTALASSPQPKQAGDAVRMQFVASASERYYLEVETTGGEAATTASYQVGVSVAGKADVVPPTDILWFTVGTQSSLRRDSKVTTRLATVLTAGQTYTFSAAASTGAALTINMSDGAGKVVSSTGNPITFTPTATSYYFINAPVIGTGSYQAAFFSAVGTSVNTPAASEPTKPVINWTVQVTPAIYTYGLQICPIGGSPSGCMQLGGPVLQDQSPNDSISTSGSADGLTWSPSSPVTQAQLNDVVNKLNASLDKAWAASPKPTWAQMTAVISAAVNNAKSTSELSTLADKGFGTGSSGGGSGTTGPDVPGALPAQCPTSKTPFDPAWMQSHTSYWAAADAHAAYLTCLKTGYNIGNCKAAYDQETLLCGYAKPACLAVVTHASDCPG